MCPKFQAPGDNDLQKTPPSRGDTSDEVPKLQLKIGSVRGLVNATLLQRIPKSTMIAQLGGPNTAELSQMLQNMVIIVSAGRRSCVCDLRVQSCRHRAGAVVSLSWLLENVHCRKTGGGPYECVNPTRQTRWSTSPQALAPPHSRRRPPWCRRPPQRASRVRASSWARAPSSPRYTAAPEDAPLRSVCRDSPCCGKPYRTADPTRPTPSLRPRSPPSSTPPEVCPETVEFDIRRTHGTTTTTRATFVTQGSLGHDEHALPGRAFLAPAPSRAAAHLVITRKEKSGAHGVTPRIKETIKFVNPTRNERMGSRNMKTCRRRSQLPPQGRTRPRRHPHCV